MNPPNDINQTFMCYCHDEGCGVKEALTIAQAVEKGWVFYYMTPLDSAGGWITNACPTHAPFIPDEKLAYAIR